MLSDNPPRIYGVTEVSTLYFHVKESKNGGYQWPELTDDTWDPAQYTKQDINEEIHCASSS
jgi:hypothetical protein